MSESTYDNIQPEVQRALAAVNEQLSPLLGVAYPDYTWAYDTTPLHFAPSDGTPGNEVEEFRRDILNHAGELRATALGADRCDMGHNGCPASRVPCPPFEEVVIDMEKAPDNASSGVYAFTEYDGWSKLVADGMFDEATKPCAPIPCGDDGVDGDDEIS